jgi:hypothetical protein
MLIFIGLNGFKAGSTAIEDILHWGSKKWSSLKKIIVIQKTYNSLTCRLIKWGDSQFRYIHYGNGDEELYDHRKDPCEWERIADNPDYSVERNRLNEILGTVLNKIGYMKKIVLIRALTIAIMVGIISLLSSGCKYNRDSDELDKFGGWTGKKFKTTGFFRVEKDARWWFVTPEGHSFLSFGINHYHAGWWNQDYNREYWNKVFGAEDAKDEKWSQGFREAAIYDLNRLGINTLGWHTDAPSLTDRPYKAVVPYFRSYKPIVLDHYRNPTEEAFVDVFSPDFAALCEETAQKVAAPYVNDPMLIGYCMSDCPIFTDNDIQIMGSSTSWSRILRNLDENAPGKQAYVALMKERYSDIEGFNATYETSFDSWSELAETKEWRPNLPPSNETEKQDNEAFTLRCVDRYYAVSKAALRKVDSKHLFLGDKLNGNTDNLEKVLEIAAKYVDVIVYQYYGPLEDQEALLDKLVPKVNVPFMNGDIGFSSPSEMIPNPYGPHAKDQAQRAAWLHESVLSCFSRPEFIGWHMCGIIDTWKTMPSKEKDQHQGIMTVTGEFYPEMEEAVKEISSEMYQSATK